MVAARVEVVDRSGRRVAAPRLEVCNSFVETLLVEALHTFCPYVDISEELRLHAVPEDVRQVPAHV